MSRGFSVSVRTPARELVRVQASEVVLPAYDGETGILPEHGDFIGLLGSGVLKIVSGEGSQYYFVDSGTYQVKSGELSVLALHAEHSREIDSEAASRRVQELESKFADTERFSPEDYDTELQELRALRARIEVCAKSSA